VGIQRSDGEGLPSSSNRASASRPSGEWNDDDYDVLANGEVVGRIIEANAGRNEVARETVLWKTWAWSRQASALIGPKGSSPC